MSTRSVIASLSFVNNAPVIVYPITQKVTLPKSLRSFIEENITSVNTKTTSLEIPLVQVLDTEMRKDNMLSIPNSIPLEFREHVMSKDLRAKYSRIREDLQKLITAIDSIVYY